MIIFVETINCIYGYHSSPYSDVGLAIKQGRYEGGASDDQVLFGYAHFSDAIKGRNISRSWAGGYGRFIVELKIPYTKMIIFNSNYETDPLAWGLPAALKNPDLISSYCRQNSSKTKHIWGGVWDGTVVLFRREVLPRIASREMDQFEDKWYPIGTLAQKYPEETLAAKEARRKNKLGVQTSQGAKKLINPNELSYIDRVKYYQNKLGRNLTGLELSSLKYNKGYVPR
jgi:hypothetical protein